MTRMTGGCWLLVVALLPLTWASDWSAAKLRARAEESVALGDFGQALTYLQEAIELEPEDAVNHYRIYKLKHRQRKYADALQDITRAVELDASNLPYRSSKAKLLVQLGFCERAVMEYELIVDAERDAAGYQTALECQQALHQAEQAFFDRDYPLAARLYAVVLSYVEAAPDLLWPKAQALFYSKDYYGAISDTGKLLKQFPQHVEAYQLRGSAFFHLGEHDQAILHFREGLKLDPEHKECKKGHKLVKNLEKKKSKGQQAFDAGDYAGAIDTWRKALEIDPTHEAFNRPLQLKLVEAYSKNGDHTDAIQLAELHVGQQESVEGLWGLAEAFTAAERFDEALRTYQRSVDAAGENAELKKQAQGKVQQAQVALKQSKEKNYYKILGIARTASSKEIKSAYRKLALKVRRDGFPVDSTCYRADIVVFSGIRTKYPKRIRTRLRPCSKTSVRLTRYCPTRNCERNTIAVKTSLTTRAVDTSDTIHSSSLISSSIKEVEGNDFTFAMDRDCLYAPRTFVLV